MSQTLSKLFINKNTSWDELGSFLIPTTSSESLVEGGKNHTGVTVNSITNQEAPIITQKIFHTTIQWSFQ